MFLTWKESTLSRNKTLFKIFFSSSKETRHMSAFYTLTVIYKVSFSVDRKCSLSVLSWDIYDYMYYLCTHSLRKNLCFN